MKSIKRILLLTDFSTVSESAVTYALHFARKLKSTVEIMHVINTPVDWVNLALEKEKLYPETKAQIGHAKSKLAELTALFEKDGISCEPSLVYNLGAEDVAKYINQETVDLIIMGSHGAKGIKEFAIGSNAQKALRTAVAPVLVVKKKPKTNEIANIVFASAFEEEQHEVFDIVHTIAEHLDANLHLLFVNTPYHFKETPEIELMLSTYCEDCIKKPCIKHHYNALNVERGISQFMQKTDIRMDIFSIATSARSGVAQLFSPSLTESLVNHLDVPVLAIHNN